MAVEAAAKEEGSELRRRGVHNRHNQSRSVITPLYPSVPFNAQNESCPIYTLNHLTLNSHNTNQSVR